MIETSWCELIKTDSSHKYSKDEILMVSHIATTKRYSKDICKKSREIAKAKVKLSLNKPDLW
jgi:hypothetical protein